MRVRLCLCSIVDKQLPFEAQQHSHLAESSCVQPQSGAGTEKVKPMMALVTTETNSNPQLTGWFTNHQPRFELSLPCSIPVPAHEWPNVMPLELIVLS